MHYRTDETHIIILCESQFVTLQEALDTQMKEQENVSTLFYAYRDILRILNAKIKLDIPLKLDRTDIALSLTALNDSSSVANGCADDATKVYHAISRQSGMSISTIRILVTHNRDS
ncbi:MAG: hypothetical protein DRI46_09595 [Chloroflexi bacterium]|nr:MAG: hypothetical protein DRI46_09595 [Chloroflexota bacterium]